MTDVLVLLNNPFESSYDSHLDVPSFWGTEGNFSGTIGAPFLSQKPLMDFFFKLICD